VFPRPGMAKFFLFHFHFILAHLVERKFDARDTRHLSSMTSVTPLMDNVVEGLNAWGAGSSIGSVAGRF